MEGGGLRAAPGTASVITWDSQEQASAQESIRLNGVALLHMWRRMAYKDESRSVEGNPSRSEATEPPLLSGGGGIRTLKPVRAPVFETYPGLPAVSG